VAEPVAIGQPDIAGADRVPGTLRVVGMLVRARLAAQLSYRRSFAADMVGQVLFVGLDFVELFAVLHRAPTVGGLDFASLLLVFALAQLGFALGSVVLGQFDQIHERVRAGTVDVLLVRPMSPLLQAATEDVALRRLGRLVTAAVILPVALWVSHPHLGAATLALTVLTPLAGAVVFAALYVISGSITFWLVDGHEFGNAFTYGGSYLAQWPVTVLPTALARVFTFVLPAAFVAYLPSLVILGRTELSPVPVWMCWASPLAALWTVALAAGCWRLALRHYTGAGG